VLAVNKPLLEAYNHMWDAGRALEIAEPRQALAPMRKAIAALQRARAAERIYLRGRPPTVVVDLNKVRGAVASRATRCARQRRTARTALDRPRAPAPRRSTARWRCWHRAATPRPPPTRWPCCASAPSATPRRWPPRSARRWPRSRPAAMRRRH
jgi:hypothetical protein